MADQPVSETVIDKPILEGEMTNLNEIRQTPDNLLSMLKSIPQVELKHSKLEIVNKIHSQIKLLGEGNSFSDINIELCKELLSQIRGCKSEIEKSILNIVLSIAELGSQIAQYLEINQFFLIFHDSGLLKKIREILRVKLNEKKNDEYFELHLQRIQTISFMNKKIEIKSEICKQYGKFLQSRIIKITEIIQKLSNDYKMNGKQLKEENDIISNEIRKGIRSINAIYCLVEDYCNKDIFVYDLKIHQTISPLIHLNCDPSLNCSQCIDLPENELIEELHGAALKTLGELITKHNNFDQYLHDYHSAYNHIVPFIIQFTENDQEQFKEDCKHQSSSQSFKQDLSFSSQTVVDGSLNLLYKLLDSYKTLCLQAGSNSILIQSLIKLFRYNRQRIGKKKNDVQGVNIRFNSCYCFGCIWDYGTNETKRMMTKDAKYIQAQAEGIGNGGGNMEENSLIISCELYNIYQMFSHLNKKSHLINRAKQGADEGIEVEGGIEEIESHLFHYEEIENDDVRDQANLAKMEMNIVYQDYTNQEEYNSYEYENEMDERC